MSTNNNENSDSNSIISGIDSDSEESCDNDNIKTAKYIKDKRLSDNTKSQYKAKAKYFEDWIESSYPQFVNKNVRRNNKKKRTILKLADINKKVIGEFYAHISKKRNKKTNQYILTAKSQLVYQSYAHVNGYSSAIKDLYRLNEVRISEDVLEETTNYLIGYKHFCGKIL